MSDGNRMPTFRDRWGLAEEPGESFARFRNRLVSAVGTVAGKYILATPAIESSFRMRLGIPEPTPKYWPIGELLTYQELTSVRDFAECDVYKRLAAAPDVSSVAEALEALFSALAKQVDMTSERAPSPTEEVSNAAREATTARAVKMASLTIGALVPQRYEGLH
ncbi:MAG TPA: hypothetical protein VMW24_06385 [Sedimentisphaerales bacterium]|nr:hypothetical protein [Sedimentisphaerales bacterium]